MKHLYLKTMLPAMGVLVLTGCIDDNYSKFDDVDTTSEIKVNHLVVPVNLSEITLDQVLDIDEEEDGIIKKYTNLSGKQYYAISKGDYFNPDPVMISTFTTDAPSIPEISLMQSIQGMPAKIALNGNLSTTFEYNVNTVDKAVNTVDMMALQNPMDISFRLNASDGSNVEITNLVISIPTDFVAEYNNRPVENGMITIPSVKSGNEISGIKVSAIKTDGIEVNHDRVPNLTYSGQIGIVSGDLNISGTAPTSLSIQFMMNSFTVNEIAGTITYDLKTPDISPVDLSDLPDFLTEGETNLILANPQIYITFNNQIGVSCTSEIVLTPMRNEMESANYSTTFDLNVDQPGNYTVMIAPNPYDEDVLDFDQTSSFPELKYVLSGSGLPEQIGVALNNTVLHGKCDVKLGVEIPFEGSYDFFAPLALGEGAVINYVHEATDWFDNDTDFINVSLLRIDATSVSELPLDADLYVYPLDRFGNVTGEAGHAILKSGTNPDFFVEIKNATEVNGVKFEAIVISNEETPLSPEQTIQLNNLKATITGSYQAKF